MRIPGRSARSASSSRQRGQLAQLDHVVDRHLGGAEALGRRRDGVGGGRELLLAQVEAGEHDGLPVESTRDVDVRVEHALHRRYRLRDGFPLEMRVSVTLAYLQDVVRDRPVALRLGELVDASAAVTATPARNEKVARARRAAARAPSPDEVAPVVSWLSGELTQRQIGVGYALLRERPAPAAEASLTVAELERALGAIGALRGPGSVAARRAAVQALLARADAAEQEFLLRLLLGDLRQGALAGVMTDAVARAAGVPASELRRALTLHGDLAAVAAIALRDGREGLAAIRLQVGRPLAPMLAGTRGGRRGRAREDRARGGRLEARRRAPAGPPRRRRRRALHAHARRRHGAAARGRRRRTRAARAGDRARRRGDRAAAATGGRSRSRSPPRASARAARAPKPLASLFFDVLHLDGEDLLDEPLARRGEALDAAVAPELRVPRARRRGCRARPARAVRRRARRRARGRGREGARRAVRGRPPRLGLAEGQAGAHARPRRARGRVGPRPPPRPALEPPPRRARRGDRRLGDARQDVQGPHRRAARVADGAAARARDAPRGDRGARAAGARRRDRVRRRPDVLALPVRAGAALRAREALSRRQDRRRGRHRRDGAGVPRRRTRAYATSTELVQASRVVCASSLSRSCRLPRAREFGTQAARPTGGRSQWEIRSSARPTGSTTRCCSACCRTSRTATSAFACRSDGQASRARSPTG